MSDRTVKISLFLLFFLNIVDATATITLINAGLVKEWNPLMNAAIEHSVFCFVFFKLLAVYTACVIFWYFRDWKAARIGMIGCLIGYSLLLLHFCIGLS